MSTSQPFWLDRDVPLVSNNLVLRAQAHAIEHAVLAPGSQSPNPRLIGLMFSRTQKSIN